ncbi:MAG: glycosyltransferase 87 family protein, partial [Anaerolineae bacterium]
WWVTQIVAFTFFSTVTVLRMGQIGPLLLLGVVGFVRYERERRDWAAGALLALIAIKPHLLYLIWPALLLWIAQTRRWRILAGAATALLAATAAASIANPRVIGQYLAATAADSPLVWATPTFGSLLRLLFGFDRRWLQFAPVVPGLIWLLIYWRRRRADWRWTDRMPLLLLVSVVTTAFGWSFDQVVLLPAVWDVVRRAIGRPPAPQAGGSHPPALQAGGLCYIFAGYAAINIGAWVLYSRVSDFWQIWLAPALLIWHLCAQSLLGREAAHPAGGR